MDTTQGNEGTTSGGSAAALPPGPASGPTRTPRRPLWRSRTQRWLTGVAGGLGEYFGIDPLIIRIVFAGLTIFHGLGVALYLIAWVLIPEEGSDRAAGQDLIDRAKNAPSWLAILLIVIGAAIAIGRVANFWYWGGGPILWGALLIGAGIWLYRRPDAPPPPLAGEPPAETQPGAGSRYGGTSPYQVPPEGAPAIPATPERTAAARVRRRRSSLGRLTVATGLVVVGAIAMLHNAGAITVAPWHYPAIALLIVGAGLLVGSFWGRSRGLVFLGLLLVPFALTASLGRVAFRGGTGERTFTPVSVAETAGGYRLGAGQMRIDLREMDWSQPVRIRATVGVGELDVTVPPDVRVDVHSHVAAGDIVLFGQERNGTDVTFDKVDGSPTATKSLVLEAEASFGEIRVDRAPAATTPHGTDGGVQ